MESPTEIWDSDNSLSLHLLPDDSDQSEGPGIVDDQHDSSDPGDEIIAEAPRGLCESHFQLLCEGSEVTLIEGMILIFCMLSSKMSNYSHRSLDLTMSSAEHWETTGFLTPKVNYY